MSPDASTILISRLLSSGGIEFDGDEIVTALVESLREAGVPVDRVALPVMAPHPLARGMVHLWSADQGASMYLATWEPEHLARLMVSPFAPILAGGGSQRRRLDQGTEGEAPVHQELRERGYTDYLAVPVPLAGGLQSPLSFATRDPAGFTDAHLLVMQSVLPAVALAAESVRGRRLAENLARTYLGPRTGPRVLAGQFVRGDAETLDAVVWFSDLRGFTRQSALLPPAGVTALLNEVFDAIGAAVTGAGGEILKFIGDAVLVAFPIGEGPVGEQVLEAARQATTAVHQLQDRDGQPLSIGVGVHVGPVAYGNVGTAERLDFTIIGATVNLAARLQGICSQLSVPFAASAAFAALCPEPLPVLGDFEVKGVPGPTRVFGLPRPMEV